MQTDVFFNSSVVTQKDAPISSPTKRQTGCCCYEDDTTNSKWHTGLCNCYEEDGGCCFCLIASFCPCVAYGMNYSLMVEGNSCNLNHCCRPCCLFATLEVAALMVNGANAYNELNGSSKGLGQDLLKIAEYAMVSHHFNVVGRKIGVFKVSDSCCTGCASSWEVMCCTSCVQTQVRNEVRYRRKDSQPFQFKPQHNTCCQICCCAKDCGCAGCVESQV
jgi:hypothetical protein